MRSILFLILGSVLLVSGCREQTAAPQKSQVAAKPRAAVKLTLLVVDDPELAAGIRLLSGEWSEQSGGELAVEDTSLADLLAKEHVSADLILYPSRQLGDFVMRSWLRPVRQSVLADPNLAFNETLPIVRDQTPRFGEEIWGIPLGEMPLVLAWWGPLPGKLPETWEELAENSQFRLSKELETGVEFPLAAEFIARVVAATPVVDRAALFFDPESMKAQLSQPQMQRALSQLRSLASHGQASDEVFASGGELALADFGKGHSIVPFVAGNGGLQRESETLGTEV